MPAFVKYTVFLSSTHDDLKQEREQVADAILKLGHIPCGMEQFSAGSGRGWNVITQTIDICDYYVLIVAGRYGTLFPGETVSWTEKEYNYARSRGLDPLAFLRHRDHIIGSRMDDEVVGIERRQKFVRRIDEECRRELWTTSDDLCARVTMALTKQIADDQRLGKDRPGWFRGDDLPGNAQVTTELARLSAENAELRTALARALTPLKPNLEIQTRLGDPVPEILHLELVEYSVTLPEFEETELTDEEILQRGHGSRFSPPPIDAPSKEELDKLRQEYRANAHAAEAHRQERLRLWASKLSRLFWIRLSISNSGPVPARDVRIRVAVSRGEFIAYASLPEFSQYSSSVAKTDDPEVNAGAISVARMSDPAAAETVFLHTVPNVGVDRAEILWGMAFLASGDPAADQTVMVSLSLDEETGVRSDKQIQMQLSKGQTWSGSESAIREHADNSRGMLRK